MLPMGGRLPKVIEQGATLSPYPEDNSPFLLLLLLLLLLSPPSSAKVIRSGFSD